MRRINRATKFKVNMTRAKHVKAWLRRSVMLLPVLGVTWSFGFLTFVSSTVVFHYIFTILNSLQGLFIFVDFCILDDSVSYFLRSVYIVVFLHLFFNLYFVIVDIKYKHRILPTEN